MRPSCWTVYDHPSDFRDWWVARRFELDRPTGDVMLAMDLERLRREFQRMGLTCLTRWAEDDPVIVESWW